MKVQYALNRIYNLLPRLIQRRDLIKEISWDLGRQVAKHDTVVKNTIVE